MNAPSIRSIGLAALSGAAFALFAVGCGHQTVVVTAADAPPSLSATPAGVPGIPFYVKHGLCRRETVWAEPQYTIQLDVLESGKPVLARTMTFPRSFLAKAGLDALLTDLDALAAAPAAASQPAQPCPADVAALWKSVAGAAAKVDSHSSCDLAPRLAAGCEPLGRAEAAGDLLRISNTASVVAEVDYQHVYYLNSRTPWIGNAQVDAKLNADGTLGEGSAQANDQTWSTILGSVNSLAGSFATYAAAAVTPVAVSETELGAPPPPPPTACAAAPGWPLPGAKVAYRVSLSTMVYLHDHVREDAGLGAACTPADGGVTDGNVTISRLDAGAAKKDDKAILVSGQVTLPKGGDDKK